MDWQLFVLKVILSAIGTSLGFFGILIIVFLLNLKQCTLCGRWHYNRLPGADNITHTFHKSDGKKKSLTYYKCRQCAKEKKPFPGVMIDLSREEIRRENAAGRDLR